MCVLKCECGINAEWVEKTTTTWQVDADCEREIKLSETTYFQCTNCKKKIYGS